MPHPSGPFGSTVGLNSTMYVRAKSDRASARRIDRLPRGQSSTVSALTSAITAAFTGSDSTDQALTTACRSGSSCILSAVATAVVLPHVARSVCHINTCGIAQRFCKPQVSGSSPEGGFAEMKRPSRLWDGVMNGRMPHAVNSCLPNRRKHAHKPTDAMTAGRIKLWSVQVASFCSIWIVIIGNAGSSPWDCL